MQTLTLRKEARMATINKAKESMSRLPIISRNVNKIKEKIKQHSIECKGSDDDHSANCLAHETPQLNKTELIDTFNQKYQLGRKIGEGSSGYVHECLHLKKQKIYACKSMMFDDEHVPLLKKNFRDMQQLDHPSIVKYKALYLDLEKHLAYLVMEYVDFVSLEKHLEELPHPINENHIKWVFEELFETLEYMHEKGVSHRDIKPDNIMVNPKTKEIKIIDFGIAKKYISRKQKTDMLTITGTLFYRAPEMFIGGGYNEKVDTWAAGVTLYEVLHGKTPFESEYHSETIESIQNMDIEESEEIEWKCSFIVKDLILRLLRKDPEERFSAKEALEQLWFEKTPIRLRSRYSDIGHIVETEYSKYHRKNIEYDPDAFKQCKSYAEILKTDSPSYHRLEIEDF